jgi:hypothetical protein
MSMSRCLCPFLCPCPCLCPFRIHVRVRAHVLVHIRFMLMFMFAFIFMFMHVPLCLLFSVSFLCLSSCLSFSSIPPSPPSPRFTPLVIYPRSLVFCLSPLSLSSCVCPFVSFPPSLLLCPPSVSSVSPLPLSVFFHLVFVKTDLNRNDTVLSSEC